MDGLSPAVYLYAGLALTGTLASIVAADLRSSNSADLFAGWIAGATCGLLVLAWGHLSIVLFAFVLAKRPEDHVASMHLAIHLWVVAVAAGVFITTIVRSWMSGVRELTEVQNSSSD